MHPDTHMDTKKTCRTFPQHKCLSSKFCEEFECSRNGALNDSFESNPIGAAFVNKEGEFVIVNKAYADILGYSIAEMINLKYTDVTHEGDIEEDYARAASVAKGQIRSYNMEKRYLKKDGSFTWAHLYVNGKYDDNDNFMYYVVHAIDIDAYMQKNHLVNFAAEAGDVGIWIWDEATNNLTWNDEMYKIYEIDKSKDVSYSDWANCIHEEDRKKAEKEVHDAMKNGVVFNTNFRIVVNGKTKYIKAKASKTGNAPNRKLTGCNIDVTEYVEMQNLLKRSNDDLENFAYLTSHDLKAPLRSIQQYLNLIKKNHIDKLDDNGKELFDIAEDNAKEMQSMISSMLALCKISTEQSGFKSINLKDVWKDVLDRMSINYKRDNISINADLDATVCGDRVQISHVFQNLLSNSINFRKKRHKLNINISVKETKDSCVVCFTDNGIGISKEELPKLFKPFNKNIKTKSNQNKEGNGLGLYICNKIMNNHQGKIWVSSELGKGSTFCLEFKKELKNAG